MFGRSKKKKEAPTPVVTQAQSLEFKAFAEDFPGEETDILAVTGVNSLDTEQAGEGKLWRVRMGLTAWKDVYTQELQQGDGWLETMADDQLLDPLRARLPRNFLVRVTVRPSEDGTRFLMTDLPQPAFDPDLKAILEEQKTPVTFQADGLGTFTLSRTMNWFQTEVDWTEQPIQLIFDQEENRDDCLAAARALLEAKEDWDRRVREFAARQLLSQVNDAIQEDGPVTEEQLLDSLEAESIQVFGNGAVDFWLHDDELLWGRAIHVSGSLTGGPAGAELED